MADDTIQQLTELVTNEISLVDKGAVPRKFLVIKREDGMAKATVKPVKKDEVVVATVEEMTFEKAQPLLKALADKAEGEEKLAMDAVLKHLEGVGSEPAVVEKNDTPAVEPAVPAESAEAAPVEPAAAAAAEPAVTAEVVTKAAEPAPAVAAAPAAPAAAPVAKAISTDASVYMWGSLEEVAAAMARMVTQAELVNKSLEGQAEVTKAVLKRLDELEGIRPVAKSGDADTKDPVEKSDGSVFNTFFG